MIEVRLSIDRKEVNILLINGFHQKPETPVKDGDIVSLFPAVGGGWVGAALDNIPSRRLLAAACAEAGIPCVYGAIQGWVAQAGISMPGDALIDKLFPMDVEIRDKSVLSFTPALCAAMQTSLCVKLLAGRPVETGSVFYFDLLNQEFETIPFA